MPTRNQAASAPADQLPDELYISFVDSLLVDTAPVFFSALSVTVIELVASIAAGHLILLLATAPLIVAAVRLAFLHNLARHIPISSIEIAHRQEFIFALAPQPV